MNLAQSTPQQLQGNLMDSLRANLMSMTMFSSMQPGAAKDNSGMYTMIYMLIITGLIDFICKTAVPMGTQMVKAYYVNKLKTSGLLTNLQSQVSHEITSSITIQIVLNDYENVLGQAILDFITSNNNTKHISFTQKNFMLNQTEPVELAADIFAKLNKKTEIITETAPTSKSGGGSSAGVEQIIEIYSYSKPMYELREFCDKITNDYRMKMQNKLGNKIFFFNQFVETAPLFPTGGKDYSKLPPNITFTMKEFKTNRKFSNLCGPEITAIQQRVNFFLKNKKWYDDKGIPYTLGLLLSGQSGAGKTSTIKCLANETQRHIININFNNDITKRQIENLFFNEMLVVINLSSGQNEKYFIPIDKRTYLFEDIDCQGKLVFERAALVNPLYKQPDNDDYLPLSAIAELTSEQLLRYNQDKQARIDAKKAAKMEQTNNSIHKLDLSFLLNLLDGIYETPGRILIMTSNFPELLDHALIRPGRIDIITNFKKCTNATIVQMIEYFYDIKLTAADLAIIGGLHEHTFSPAEIGKYLFENFDDHTLIFTKLQHHDEILNAPVIEDIAASPLVPIELTKTSPKQDLCAGSGDNCDKTPTSLRRTLQDHDLFVAPSLKHITDGTIKASDGGFAAHNALNGYSNLNSGIAAFSTHAAGNDSFGDMICGEKRDIHAPCVTQNIFAGNNHSNTDGFMPSNNWLNTNAFTPFSPDSNVLPQHSIKGNNW